MLPADMDCGSGMTCWRRVRDGQEAGIWERLHHVLLNRRSHLNAIDWSRVALDSNEQREERVGDDRPHRRAQPAHPHDADVLHRPGLVSSDGTCGVLPLFALTLFAFACEGILMMRMQRRTVLPRLLIFARRLLGDDRVLLALLAVLLGAVAGAAAIAFRLAISGFQWLAWGDGGDLLASQAATLPW